MTEAASRAFTRRQHAADVPLTGADCFLRAFDAECLRWCGAGHLSQLVLRLGAGFDAERFRATLEAAARANPILRAPVVRGRTLVPVYRTTRPSPSPPVFALHAASGTDEGEASPPASAGGYRPPSLLRCRLSDPTCLEGGRLLRVDGLARADGGTDLAFTWAHLLFDGQGSERFVAWLADCGNGKRSVGDLSEEEGAGLVVAETAAWRRGLRARSERARAWQAHLASLATPAPRSLAGPLARVAQDVRYEVSWLSSEATARALARAHQMAGRLTPALFPLAASIRAHAAVFRARGISPGSFVVPVVANARPRGAGGAAHAIFRTHVSMLWLRALPEETEDLDGLVRVLKERRLAFVRAGLLEAGLSALDLARIVPKRLYARGVRRTFGGELASFFFAYTGALLPDTRSFFGAPVEGGLHVPGVPPSPGSAIVFSLHGGRLGVTHAWQQGTIDEEERALLRATLLADLTGAQAAPA